MKKATTYILAFVLTLVTSTAAFLPSKIATERMSNVVRFGYIPDGFTKESYAKFKAAEAKKKEKKNLGRMGPKGRNPRLCGLLHSM